ncbi:MAG: hypothetical protein LBD23_12875 [Oscillospiraceae bacterium]|jgi:hypothetical protein|nr:hypothetical protein [Oscillospiraceae bacterium]
MGGDDLDYDEIMALINKRDEEEKKQKKKKTDWLRGTTNIMSLCAWCIMLVVWVVIELAAPAKESLLFTSFFNVRFGSGTAIRTQWDYTLVYVAYVLMLVSLGICMIGFILNRARVMKQGGKYSISIMLIGGITIVVFVIFLINFGSTLF